MRLGWVAWVGALLAVVAFSGCRESKTDQLEYRSEAPEETAVATKDVFAGAADGSSEGVSAGIRDYFQRLGRATRSEGEIDADAFLSVDAMLTVMDSAGILEGMSRKEERLFREAFRKRSSVFGASLKQMAFDQHRILKVEDLGKDDRMVFVRLYDNDFNVTMQMRWWLVKTDAGWRAYDFEDLSVGIRSISLMSIVMKSGLGGKCEPWVSDLLRLVQMMQGIDYTDLDEVEGLRAPLKKMRGHPLPIDVKRFTSFLMVTVMQSAEEFSESLEELEAAKNGGYDSPLYHYLKGHSLMGLERYSEALVEFEKHSEVLGWDSDVLESVSDCHLHLGDTESARKAALQGLEDNPRSINCLASLVAASTPDQIRSEEVGKMFDESGQVEWAYEVAFDYLFALEQEEQAEVLFEVIKDKYPESELAEYCAAMLEDEETEE
ncbi:MAG: hypothetical protein AAGI48_05770 [Verrucomicrobiota bacterium]